MWVWVWAWVWVWVWVWVWGVQFEVFAVLLCRTRIIRNNAATGGGARLNVIRGLNVNGSVFQDNSAALNQSDATRCSADTPGAGGALCIEATDVS